MSLPEALSADPRTRRRCAVGVALALCLALAAGAVGCSNAAPPAPTPPAPTPPSDGSSAETDAPVPLDRLQLELTRRWDGLDSPLYVTNAGDESGRLFIVEQGGLVKVVENGSVQHIPFLDLRSKTLAEGERGLLGVAFSPTYATDGRVYVDYTDRDGNTVIACYTTTVPGSSSPVWRPPTILMTIEQPYANHNGGCLQFGPDGYLYIGMGDGGSGGDPENRAQNRTSLLGKMLRIDPDTPAAGAPYAIPPTNPSQVTANAALKPLPEVWALGVRNPWRFSFDASGGALWLADVGQNAFEEVNVVQAAEAEARAREGGLNFGWRPYEGLHTYPSGAPVPPTDRDPGYVWPVAEYPQPEAQSITGGYVYRGNAYPAMRGTYVCGDFEKGWVAGIRTEDENGAKLATPETRTLLTTPHAISSFGVDEEGELYLVDYRGAVYQVSAMAK